MSTLAVASPALAAREKQIDRDRDGLSDSYERHRSHTSPARTDTDRDGLRDGREVRRYHTAPRLRDTDRDRLRDGFEVRVSHTSPRRRDTDRDRLTDSWELRVSHTDPRRADTDGDGISDFMEAFVALGPPHPKPGPPQSNRPDFLPPDTLITSGPSGATTATSASFSFGSSEGGSTFECRLDAGSWGACSSPMAYSSLASGTHSFDVRARDAAGNIDPTPASLTWTINATDVSPPDTSITSGPSGTVTATDASFSFGSSEGGSTFECRLDAGSWGACSSPKAYSSLASGTHSFDVRARDAAGNLDASPASRSWTVSPLPGGDVSPPDTSITSGPSGTVTATDASFSFGSSEGGSTFECRLDAGSWGACSSPKAYSSLASGTHSFDVRARDAAGNVDASPASRSWTVSVSSSGGGCDSTVSTQAQLVSAAASTANEGKVVCVANGSYGDLALGGFNHPTKVTLRALNSGQATIGSVSLHNVAGVRFEGFRQTGKFHNDQYAASRIEVARGDIGGGSSTAFLMSDNANDWLIERNHIHDISFNGSFGSGYGIYAYGSVPKRGLKVRYNTFAHTQADAMELGNLDGFEIVGNDVHDINWFGASSGDPHADALMIWADSKNGLVKDNRFTNGNGVLLSRVSNTRIENNLFANIDNWCFQNGYAVGQTIVNNTVYDCGSDYNGGGMGGGYGMTLDQASASANALSKNLLTSLSYVSNAIGSSDHNLIKNGGWPRSTDIAFTPTLANTLDYQATNLPAGYTDVGYRPAPAGHNAP